MPDKYDEATTNVMRLCEQHEPYSFVFEEVRDFIRSAFPPPAEDARALVQAWMNQGLPLMYQEPIALASDISRFAELRVEPWREALREAVDLLNASQDYWTQEDWDDVSRFGKMLSDSPAKEATK